MKKLGATLAIFLMLLSLSSPAHAVDPAKYPFFKRGAVDLSKIVDNSIKVAMNRIGDSIKNKEMDSLSSLFTASMAMDWFAVRTVLFGITGADKVDTILTSENRRMYNKQIANAYVVNLLRNHAGDQKEEEDGQPTIRERLDEHIKNWDGGDPESLFNNLRPLLLEVYGSDLGAQEAYEASIGSVGAIAHTYDYLHDLERDFTRLEVLANLASKIKDIPGLSGEKGSLWDKLYYVGTALLVFALVIRLGVMFYNYSLGKMDDTAINELIRYVVYFLIMASVPLLCLSGIGIADGIKEMILGDNPEGRYELLRSTLELRSEYVNLDGSGFFGLPTLTELVAIVAALLAQAIVYILLILGDVMMAITIMASSLVIPLSLLPSFQDYFSKWMRAVITFLFYPVAAAIYTVLMTAVIVSSFEMSSLSLIVISICYLMGALKIPNIAEQMNGAVMASVASALAAAPMKAAGAGLSAGASALTGGAGKVIGAVGKAAGKIGKGIAT